MALSETQYPSRGVGAFGALFFGVFAYLMFMGSMTGLVLFLLNLGPFTVSGPATMAPLAAVAVNLGLILLFGLTHSVLAREKVKAILMRWTCSANYRSWYVAQAAVFLTLIFVFWQPVGPVIWQVTGWPALALQAGVLVGLSFTFLATFQFDHFELFGLKQVYAQWRRAPQPEIPFRVPALYRYIRHPMMTGMIVALLSTPLMTVGHAIFAAAMIGYIFIGVYFEERSLRRTFPQDYPAYATQVPMFLPRLLPRRG